MSRTISLIILLCLNILIISGCKPPCRYVAGSCLALNIFSSSESSQLKVTFLPNMSEWNYENVSFPMRIEIRPPIGQDWKDLQSINIEAQSMLKNSETGEIIPTWPAGSHIDYDIVLSKSPTVLGPSPMMSSPWQYTRVNYNYADASVRGVMPIRIDGDANADIVGMADGLPQLVVFQSLGNGQYKPHQSLTVSQIPSSLLVADVNNDLREDILTIAGGSGYVHLLLANGNMTFGPEMTMLARPGLRLGGGALTDINDDGRIDFALANPTGVYGSTIIVFSDIATGAARRMFDEPAYSILFQKQATSITPASFAIAGLPRQSVITDAIGSVLFWNSLDPADQPGNEMRPTASLVADIDNDGTQDLLIAYSQGVGKPGQLRALTKFNGTGFRRSMHADVPASPRGLWVGDLQGDGYLDIVTVCDEQPQSLQFWFIGPKAGPSESLTWSINLGQVLGDPAILDVNGDQRADIVVPVPKSRGIETMLGQL